MDWALGSVSLATQSFAHDEFNTDVNRGYVVWDANTCLPKFVRLLKM